jgi:hypothetical protein
MSEDKQKQEENKKDPTLLETVRQIVSITLYQLITRWLDDEDGVLVEPELFPYKWFTKRIGNDGELYNAAFYPYVYRSELSTYFGPRYKIIYWNSCEIRRGICIFVDDGAFVGFSECGNGSTVLMTWINEYNPEYDRIVKPIIQAHKSWLDDVESIHQK